MNMPQPSFKVCPLCKKQWVDREDLLNDAAVELKGYQVNSTNPPKGLFIFLHKDLDCHTSFAVEAETFLFLLPDLPEAMFARSFVPGAQAGCQGHCHDPDNLEVCQGDTCSGQVIRQLLARVRERLQSAAQQ